MVKEGNINQVIAQVFTDEGVNELAESDVIAKAIAIKALAGRAESTYHMYINWLWKTADGNVFNEPKNADTAKVLNDRFGVAFGTAPAKPASKDVTKPIVAPKPVPKPTIKPVIAKAPIKPVAKKAPPAPVVEETTEEASEETASEEDASSLNSKRSTMGLQMTYGVCETCSEFMEVFLVPEGRTLRQFCSKHLPTEYQTVRATL